MSKTQKFLLFTPCYMNILISKCLCVCFFGVAYTFIKPTIDILLRLSKGIGESSWAIKCIINYSWCSICCCRWDRWFCTKLLPKSISQQSLYAWSILKHYYTMLFQFHPGMLISFFTSYLIESYDHGFKLRFVTAIVVAI